MLALASPNNNDTVLLDFGADWCGYCRQMEPVVGQLAAQGFPVRKVNVDKDHALAEKYGVQGLPCFILLVNGKEVDRVVGATDHNRLLAMFHRNGVEPGGESVAHGKCAAIAEDPDAGSVSGHRSSESLRFGIGGRDGNCLGRSAAER